MNLPGLSQSELTAWVGLAAVLELLPGVLNSQLRRDAELTHFEYYALAVLSEAPRRTLPMTSLSVQTHATLARLLHVAQRWKLAAWSSGFPRRTTPASPMSGSRRPAGESSAQMLPGTSQPSGTTSSMP